MRGKRYNGTRSRMDGPTSAAALVGKFPCYPVGQGGAGYRAVPGAVLPYTRRVNESMEAL